MAEHDEWVERQAERARAACDTEFDADRLGPFARHIRAAMEALRCAYGADPWHVQREHAGAYARERARLEVGYLRTGNRVVAAEGRWVRAVRAARKRAAVG